MNETLLKDNDDVATLRHIDQNLGNTIIKVSKTEKGLILLANEGRWLHDLNDSGFTPRLFMDEPGRIVMQDLGDSQEIKNLYNFRRNSIYLLNFLRRKGVKHGDLTAPNIIIKNDHPMAIDWGEAVELGGSLPSKRPEPDATHLWAVVADHKDTTRFAGRWLAIREAYGVDRLEGSTMLDLGCHEGAFVAAAAVEGVESLGIDQDIEAINRAFVLWPGLGIAGFIHSDIKDFVTSTLINQRYHMGLLLSVWPYLVNVYGAKEALELLAAIKAKCEVLFFESQLAGDGPGPDFFGIKGDVAQLLSYLPGVGKVEEIITLPVAGRDAARTVFMVS